VAVAVVLVFSTMLGGLFHRGYLPVSILAGGSGQSGRSGLVAFGPGGDELATTIGL